MSHTLEAVWLPGFAPNGNVPSAIQLVVDIKSSAEAKLATVLTWQWLADLPRDRALALTRAQGAADEDAWYAIAQAHYTEVLHRVSNPVEYLIARAKLSAVLRGLGVVGGVIASQLSATKAKDQVDE